MQENGATSSRRLPAAPPARSWRLWATASVPLVAAAFLLADRLSEPEAPPQPEPIVRSRTVPIKPMQVSQPQAVPLLDPQDLKPISAPEALIINAATPVAETADMAAAPLIVEAARRDVRDTALQCLTSALYYEAASEPADGQRAVAQVVLNRVRHPAYPASVCGVVYQGSTRKTGCQFTFTCDGSLARTPSRSAWQRSRKLAEAALSGQVFAPVGHATHYHADFVVPYWASSLDKVITVGRHIFYRWSGRPGKPAAFSQRYAQAESAAAALAAAAQSVGRPTLDTALLADASNELVGREARPERSRAKTVLEEDRRAASTLLADASIGRLVEPAASAERRRATSFAEVDSLPCIRSGRAAPVRPNGSIALDAIASDGERAATECVSR